MKTKKHVSRPSISSNRGVGRAILDACQRFLPAKAFCTLAFVLALTGCQQPNSQMGDVGGTPVATSPYTSTKLGEGDTLRVAYEGDTNMNAVVKVQLDGTITLPLIGTFKAAGLTPEELRTALMARYKTLLSVNEITVTLLSASASVYVSGAVLKPGRIPLDRPMTALEAVMEAGGFDSRRAKGGSVSVIRKEGDKQRHFTLNLKSALAGEDPNPFFVQPYDIIHVPEKTFNF